MPNTTTSTKSRPGLSQIALLLHIRKTVSLASAVLGDMRVHWLPKLLFIMGLGALVLALFFPEMAGDILVFFGIPGFGAIFDALGLPVDAALDWTLVAVAAFNLLKIFPSDIVGEHYDRLFRSNGKRSA